MPQTWLCVNCYQCSMFQVQQEKTSSNKFTCKMCHEKQSARTIYCRSHSAKEVREDVQQRNMRRGQAQEAQQALASFQHPDARTYDDAHPQHEDAQTPFLIMNEQQQPRPVPTSRWSSYLDDGVQQSEDGFDDAEDGCEEGFVTCLPEGGARRPKAARSRQTKLNIGQGRGKENNLQKKAASARGRQEGEYHPQHDEGFQACHGLDDSQRRRETDGWGNAGSYAPSRGRDTLKRERERFDGLDDWGDSSSFQRGTKYAGYTGAGDQDSPWRIGDSAAAAPASKSHKAHRASYPSDGFVTCASNDAVAFDEEVYDG